MEVISLSLNVPEFDLILFTNLFGLHHKNLKELMCSSESQSDGRGWVDPKEKDDVIKMF